MVWVCEEVTKELKEGFKNIWNPDIEAWELVAVEKLAPKEGFRVVWDFDAEEYIYEEVPVPAFDPEIETIEWNPETESWEVVPKPIVAPPPVPPVVVPPVPLVAVVAIVGVIGVGAYMLLRR